MKAKELLFPAGVLLAAGLVAALLLGSVFRRAERAPILPQSLMGKTVVALTFDDGPDARYTLRLLDVLYEEQVPATFFLVGEQIKGNELIVKEIAASGQEIGSHTSSHHDLTRLSEAETRLDLERMEAALDKALGRQAAVKYLRPPYGGVPGLDGNSRRSEPGSVDAGRKGLAGPGCGCHLPADRE